MKTTYVLLSKFSMVTAHKRPTFGVPSPSPRVIMQPIDWSGVCAGTCERARSSIKKGKQNNPTQTKPSQMKRWSLRLHMDLLYSKVHEASPAAERAPLRDNNAARRLQRQEILGFRGAVRMFLNFNTHKWSNTSHGVRARRVCMCDTRRTRTCLNKCVCVWVGAHARVCCTCECARKITSPPPPGTLKAPHFDRK